MISVPALFSTELVPLIAGLGGGAVAVLLGAIIRFGGLRSHVRGQLDPAYPTQYRAFLFALVPCGLCFMTVGALGLIWRAEQQLPGGVVLTALLFALCMMLVTQYIAQKMPTWAQPAWIHEEMAANGGRLVGPGADYAPLSSAAYWLGWVCVGAVVVLQWLLTWPAAIDVGLALGVAILVAKRPRAKHRSGSD